MFDITAFAHGLALGLGMFVCPGPKDVLILRQALLRQPAAELIAVGTLSDALLISLGMAGASAALSRAPAFQTGALWLGVVLLVGHGLLAARRALRATGNISGIPMAGGAQTRGKSLAALLMVSFFSPLAWLDTLLVIGTVGAALPSPRRPGFAFGAFVASLVWFLALVIGGRKAGRWMTERRTWRVLDAFVALVMIGLGLQRVRELL